MTPRRPGEVRDEAWNRLLHARAVSYPLPPHGHHPHFVGAADAARRLLAHPRVRDLGVLLVGPERALHALRKRALEEGRVLFVPDRHRPDRYRRLHGDPRAAQLGRMAEFSGLEDAPTGVRAAVLACVLAGRDGGRLSKGFGWGARGVPTDGPTFTLAHPLMLVDALPCPPDSRVALIATPHEVVEAGEG